MWTRIERRFEDLFVTSGGVVILFVQSLADIRLGRNDVKRLLRQMELIGVNTLPLATMIGLFTGMIFSLNFGIPLQELGAEAAIGSILSIAMVRELAPVFTAIILAARVGAALTAELGTMAVTDEIDTLRVLGIRPTRYLAMPRIVASLLMNPLLTTYAAAAGLIGGMVLSNSYLGVPPSLYWDRVLSNLDMEEIRHGITKAIVFGGLYSTICVYRGLTTRGGAEGVGRSTTSAVVAALTMILIADYLLTRVLFG